METIRIIDAKDYVGEEVTIKGWVANTRSSGKISFLELRDGTAYFQGVVLKQQVDEAVFDLANDLTQETAIEVVGTIEEDARSKFGFEIHVNEITVIGESHDYPITPKDHGVEFLLDNRHLWVRSKRQMAILKIRNQIIKATNDFFVNNGYENFNAPILQANSAENTTDLFETDYFDSKAYLTQSSQLYLEAGAMALGDVYTVSPTFRAEKSKTRRHLIEFWMIEAEMAFKDQEASLKVQEDFIAYLIQSVIDNCDYELDIIDRDVDVLKSYTKTPFPRISYDEAISLLQENDFAIEWGEDFGSPHETFLAEHYSQPVFILNYPKEIKAFYMKHDEERDDIVICADLIAPEGYGEIIGGSERETDYDTLRASIEANGLDVADYEWYLDLRKYGSVPHSGFGLGLERFVTWICKLDHVRESIPFPRLLNRLNP